MKLDLLADLLETEKSFSFKTSRIFAVYKVKRSAEINTRIESPFNDLKLQYKSCITRGRQISTTNHTVFKRANRVDFGGVGFRAE